MPARPRFITLEGGEGAGKSTQAARLAAALEAGGIPVCLTREPGGSPGAEQIRMLLVEGEQGRWDPLTETLLLFAARADHLAHTIRPALEAGQWVISDRFTDSTYAYQGAGRGLDDSSIAAIDSATTSSFKSDLTIILDVPVEQGLSRAGTRGAGEARFECFDRDFHARIRDYFVALAAREPERCVLLDGSAPPDAAATAIWNVVRGRFRL
ncbi:MAG TPA: dTMP kinase [Rhizomicrobium sp.]|jgi:dTMP kinase|nr:dTMP kinase [Rhizomicrobium sp.]